MSRIKTPHPKASKRRYTLELSERQAELLSRAAELYARFGTGHFYVLENFLWSDLERARPHIKELQLIKNGSIDVLPGIYAAKDDHKVLYDLHQVVRHRVARDRDPKTKSWTVDCNPPLRAGKREGLARFEEIIPTETSRSAVARRSNKKTSGRRYVLEFSERQAELLSHAAELYARMGLGQFNVLDRFFWEPINAIQEAHKHLDALRLIKNGSLNSDPGISSDSIDDDYRVLYDLHQVIRHRLAWDRDPEPKGLKGVSFDTPRQLSKHEPLANIAAVAANLARAKP